MSTVNVSIIFCTVLLNYTAQTIMCVTALWFDAQSVHPPLPEREESCLLLDDLLSCLKEFSSSASPSPHQDGWPYKGVPRGSAVTSPETDAQEQTLFFNKDVQEPHTAAQRYLRPVVCIALHLQRCAYCANMTTSEPSCSVYLLVWALIPLWAGVVLHHWPIFGTWVGCTHTRGHTLSSSCCWSQICQFRWKRGVSVFVLITLKPHTTPVTCKCSSCQTGQCYRGRIGNINSILWRSTAGLEPMIMQLRTPLLCWPHPALSPSFTFKYSLSWVR